MSDFNTFLQEQPLDNQPIIQEIHTTIMSWYPECDFSLSYSIPTYKLNKKLLVHFNVYKHHIGLYPGPETLLKHHELLSGYRSSKGAIQIPRQQPFPFDLLKALCDSNAKD